MTQNRAHYEYLCRLPKKKVVELAGYKNIKEAYMDLGSNPTLSKKISFKNGSILMKKLINLVDTFEAFLVMSAVAASTIAYIIVG